MPPVYRVGNKKPPDVSIRGLVEPGGDSTREERAGGLRPEEIILQTPTTVQTWLALDKSNTAQEARF